MDSRLQRPTCHLGRLAPEAARPELRANDATATETDVVNHTFAAEITVDMISLRNEAGRLNAHEPDSEEGRADQRTK